MSAELPLIPTHQRDKIAHTLSFPIGAETISQILRDAPQYPRFGLNFMGPSQGSWWLRPLPVLTISYYKRASDIFRGHTAGAMQALNGVWQIQIRPVHREQRNLVREKLNEMLPQALPWLQKRAELDAIGDDELCFQFNGRDESLTLTSFSQVSPATASKRK